MSIEKRPFIAAKKPFPVASKWTLLGLNDYITEHFRNQVTKTTWDPEWSLRELADELNLSSNRCVCLKDRDELIERLVKRYASFVNTAPQMGSDVKNPFDDLVTEIYDIIGTEKQITLIIIGYLQVLESTLYDVQLDYKRKLSSMRKCSNNMLRHRNISLGGSYRRSLTDKAVKHRLTVVVKQKNWDIYLNGQYIDEDIPFWNDKYYDDSYLCREREISAIGILCNGIIIVGTNTGMIYFYDIVKYKPVDSRSDNWNISRKITCIHGAAVNTHSPNVHGAAVNTHSPNVHGAAVNTHSPNVHGHAVNANEKYRIAIIDSLGRISMWALCVKDNEYWKLSCYASFDTLPELQLQLQSSELKMKYDPKCLVAHKGEYFVWSVKNVLYRLENSKLKLSNLEEHLTAWCFPEDVDITDIKLGLDNQISVLTSCGLFSVCFENNTVKGYQNVDAVVGNSINNEFIVCANNKIQLWKPSKKRLTFTFDVESVRILTANDNGAIFIDNTTKTINEFQFINDGCKISKLRACNVNNPVLFASTAIVIN